MRWLTDKRASLKLARMRRVLSVSELSPGEFAARLDQMIAVYAAAMRPPADMLPGRRSIMAVHAAQPGFRALLATEDGSGRPAGFGYGFHGARGQWWHDTVARGLAATHGTAAAAAWLDDSFEVAELHVRPEYQKHGIGKQLLLRLTRECTERIAVLSTMDTESPARRLYRSLGFTELLTDYWFAGADTAYAVMGAALPLLSERPLRSRY
jgi:ribosomal protein S18 acetylase RimI-like enzyme